MSYYTRLELTWDDGDYTKGNLEVKDLINVAKKFTSEYGWHDDVLKDLELATSNQGLQNPGFNNVYSFGVIALLISISKEIPNVTFFARGVGENLDDIWLRQIRSGEIERERGPFEDEVAENNFVPPSNINQMSYVNKPWWKIWD